MKVLWREQHGACCTEPPESWGAHYLGSRHGRNSLPQELSCTQYRASLRTAGSRACHSTAENSGAHPCSGHICYQRLPETLPEVWDTIGTHSIGLRSTADGTYLIMAPVPAEGHLHNPLVKRRELGRQLSQVLSCKCKDLSSTPRSHIYQ